MYTYRKQQSQLIVGFATSAVPIQNMPVQNRSIAWPPVLLLPAFSKTAHPNNFRLDTALPWVLSNTPAKCEVDRMNGCPDNQRTDRQTESIYL